MTYVQTSRRSEQGFTLVELAIVMVIIGLLIGGILKGQELIANAKVTATVSQLKGLDAAINTFQDKYNAIPGDMNTATARVQNCGSCTNGNGNGVIGGTLAAPAATAEGAQAFAHMSAAQLLSGIDTSGNSATFGRLLPTVRAGGGLWLGYANAAVANTNLLRNRHYAVLNGNPTTVSATSGALTATTAAQIDRKLDDGQPRAGSVQTVGTGCTAGTGAALTYDEANTTSTCVMYSQVLN